MATKTLKHSKWQVFPCKEANLWSSVVFFCLFFYDIWLWREWWYFSYDCATLILLCTHPTSAGGSCRWAAAERARGTHGLIDAQFPDKSRSGRTLKWLGKIDNGLLVSRLQDSGYSEDMRKAAASKMVFTCCPLPQALLQWNSDLASQCIPQFDVILAWNSCIFKWNIQNSCLNISLKCKCSSRLVEKSRLHFITGWCDGGWINQVVLQQQCWMDTCWHVSILCTWRHE